MKPRLYEEQRIEQALSFLFHALETSRNQKPVGLHSIRVATLLWEHQEDEDIIIAALLHDLVEDTDTSSKDIEEKFGKAVAEIVVACTFDSGGNDYSQKLVKSKASIDAAVGLGRRALLVKAADFIDNANYYAKANNPDLRKYLYDKYIYFMKVAKKELSESNIWKQLESTYNSQVDNLMAT